MKKLALVLGLGLMFVACGDNTKEKEASAPALVIEDPAQATVAPAQATVAPTDEKNADVKPEAEAPATSEDQTKPDEQKEEKAQ